MGANLILDWQAHGNEALINLKRPTYSGNSERLNTLELYEWAGWRWHLRLRKHLVCAKAICQLAKPAQAKSNYAVTGLCLCAQLVVAVVRNIMLLPRGELEITDPNRLYLTQSNLSVERMGHCYVCPGIGSCYSLLEANHLIASLKHCQGANTACPEEITFRQKWNIHLVERLFRWAEQRNIAVVYPNPNPNQLGYL